jgi:hypothetical protein
MTLQIHENEIIETVKEWLALRNIRTETEQIKLLLYSGSQVSSRKDYEAIRADVSNVIVPPPYR